MVKHIMNWWRISMNKLRYWFRNRSACWIARRGHISLGYWNQPLGARTYVWEWCTTQSYGLVVFSVMKCIVVWFLCFFLGYTGIHYTAYLPDPTYPKIESQSVIHRIDIQYVYIYSHFNHTWDYSMRWFHEIPTSQAVLRNSFSTSADTLQALSKYPALGGEDLEFVQNKAPKARSRRGLDGVSLATPDDPGCKAIEKKASATVFGWMMNEISWNMSEIFLKYHEISWNIGPVLLWWDYDIYDDATS